MLFISHDRYFLNKFASKIWSMKNGAITTFDGGFDDFIVATSAVQSQASVSPAAKKKKPLSVKSQEPSKPKASPESLIYEAEAELVRLNDEIELCVSHSKYGELNELYQKKQQLEGHISSLYDAWAKGDVDGG
jgi:ATPase subunit of ABC transporter with duplicated ATPase domains